MNNSSIDFEVSHNSHKLEEEGELMENDNERASLNQNRKIEEPSKPNEASESKFKHPSLSIKETVFQKMKKKTNPAVKIKDLHNNKVNSQAPFAKNSEEVDLAIPDNKPMML